MPEGWTWLLKPEIMWFFIGLILLFAEFAIPGIVILFFGLGAWLTALICWALNISLTMQLLLFLVSSLFFIFAFRRRFMKIMDSRAAQPRPFQDSLDDCIGKRVTVVREIGPDRKGRVEFNGTLWDAEAETPIAEGDTAEIVGRDNITFKVMPV